MALVHETVLVPGARLRPTLPQEEQAAPAERIPAAAIFPDRVDVAIIGGGISGLSIGWQLALRGQSVAVFERDEVGAGASLAATGMLAAAAEHEPGHPALLPLALESQQLWPAFAQELQAASGIGVDFREDGTLLIALTRDEVERLRFRHEQHRRDGLKTRWVTGAEARQLEPALRPNIAAGIFCADDHQVDPRLVMVALARAFRNAGGHLVENISVDGLEMAGGRVTGVMLPGKVCHAATVIVATGAWSGENGLLPINAEVPVRPLKGQALCLRTNAETGTLSRILWTEQVHMAAKSDGRLIVGATMEERGFDARVTAGGVYALLEAARRALPSVEEMEIEAAWTGFRPTSIDDAPVLGEAGIRGLVLATGHHRNGILLAPVTAKAIVSLLLEGEIRGPAAAFGLERFGAEATTKDYA